MPRFSGASNDFKDFKAKLLIALIRRCSLNVCLNPICFEPVPPLLPYSVEKGSPHWRDRHTDAGDMLDRGARPP